ncbi:MAG: hypothetical protein QW738_06775 [Nitrososphaeria archaeon]
MAYGVALDLGTSGFRAQVMCLKTGKVISTGITLRHPLPGGNIVDHLHFAVEVGYNRAHEIIIRGVNALLRALHIDLNKVERIAVCGNPCQLSLFQNIQISLCPRISLFNFKECHRTIQ